MTLASMLSRMREGAPMQRCWEDLEEGETVQLGTATLSREEIVAFASEFDPQPFHLDDAAARATLLGGQAASGWHTCIVANRLVEAALADHGLALTTSVADDIRWRKPVRPGDAISGRVVIGAKAPCACRGDRGTCRVFVSIVNQHGEVVATWHFDCLVTRRFPATIAVGDACQRRVARMTRVSRVRGDHAIKFFDDVNVGDEIDLGSYCFSSERVAGFDDRYGHAQCMAWDAHRPDNHVNEWHVVSAWMHCIVRYYRLHSEQLRRRGGVFPLLGPAAGVKHLRWQAPVRSGEVISYSTWAERKLEIASRDDWGLLVAGAEGVNASGERVVTFYPQMLLQRSASDKRRAGAKGF